MQWELWMLQMGGMTPHGLRCATLEGARYRGLDRDIGSLEPGSSPTCRSRRQPLDDIRNAEQVHWTVVNGRVYDSMKMDEVGNRPKPRAKFFFEGNSGALPRARAQSED